MLAWIEVAIKVYGWKPSRIFILGYAQGGTVAMDVGLHVNTRIGGIVCASGGLVDIFLQRSKGTATFRSPLLMMHGQQDSQYPIHCANLSMDQYCNHFNCTPASEGVHRKEYCRGAGMLVNQVRSLCCMNHFTD